MTPSTIGQLTELDVFVEEFEAAQQRCEAPDIADFLPEPQHPLFVEVLRELVRIDLDYGWCRRKPRRVDWYLARFPRLNQEREALRDVLFEEFRQRRLADEDVTTDEYIGRFGIDPLAGGHDDDHGSSTDADDAEVDAFEQPDSTEIEWPEPGQVFLGFRLAGELGRGAFGRAYLAYQDSLAGRPVCLKVTTSFFGESQYLARMQHTNIVPIFSVHRLGPFQAVCMPYFGGATLAQLLVELKSRGGLPASGTKLVSTLHERRGATLAIEKSAAAPGSRALPGSPPSADDDRSPATAALLKLRSLNYVEAVLWMAGRLADGLAHAHERGIVHRDLKPANVLLTDDGQPMLLDFNLSADVQRRRHADEAFMGGTLPYMSPEQLRGFLGSTGETIDGRSDVYSLGLLVFELLAGRPAFRIPSGAAKAAYGTMLMDREQPPSLRATNSAVSPAVEAIVKRCLQPDPAQRYASAKELREDIDLQLAHRPLRHAGEPSWRERLSKWRHRHPQLTSATAVAVVAVGLLFAAGGMAVHLQKQVRQRDAANSLRDFLTAADSVEAALIRTPEIESRADALRQARAIVDRYGVGTDKHWDRKPAVTALSEGDRNLLRNQLGDLLFLMAQCERDISADKSETQAEAARLSDLARQCYVDQPPHAWWQQRAELARALGDPAAEQFDATAKITPCQTANDWFFAATRKTDLGDYAGAVKELSRAVEAEPTHYWAWLLLGNCQHQLGQEADATSSYSTCIGLNPRQARAFFNRGVVLLRQGKSAPAEADFAQAIRLQPDWPTPRINRVLALERLRKFTDAESELNTVLESPEAPTRAYFLRARVRQQLGKKAEAEADLAEGMRREPKDSPCYVTRGFARLKDDPAGALADFEAAERLNPRSITALQNQAHVLSERLNRADDSLRAMDRLLAMYPDSPKGLAGRAILLARAGRADEAVRDARRCLEVAGQDPAIRYQLAGVYARTADKPGHLQTAIRLLSEALLRGEGFKTIATDEDLQPIRDREEFQRLMVAVRTLTSPPRR